MNGGQAGVKPAEAPEAPETAPAGPLWRYLATVLLVAVVVGGWVTYIIIDYRGQQHARAEEILERSAAGDALEIGRWLDEGFVDAEVMATQSGVAERYVRWQRGEDSEFPGLLRDRLLAERDIRGYACISMYTRDEQPFATTSQSDCDDPKRLCADLALKHLGSEVPMFDDHSHNGHGEWSVSWSGPVRRGPGEPVIGVMVYTVEVRDAVVRILRDEPLPYRSARVAVVGTHEEGFDIITSANGFEPITVEKGPQLHTQLAADLDAQESVVRTGVGEEGGAVMAAAQRVPRTGWFVASRADMSEIDGPVWRFGFLVSLSAVLVVAVFTLGILTVRRTRLERYREHAALLELQEALDTRDRFMRSMSHELRTPLHSIMGFTSIMLSGMAGPVSDEQNRQLGMVDMSSKRLLALVDDVLDLAAIRDNGVRVSATEFTSDEVADAVIGTMRPLMECQDLECRYVHHGSPMHLTTDRDMVERIMLNLLSNAIKFTESGYVELVVRPDGQDHVVFEVADSGRGIPVDEIDKVMEEFHQFVEPDGVKPVGTGLGLAISKRMAGALGGELTVASELGVGSVFTLRIPRIHGRVALV